MHSFLISTTDIIILDTSMWLESFSSCYLCAFCYWLELQKTSHKDADFSAMGWGVVSRVYHWQALLYNIYRICIQKTSMDAQMRTINAKCRSFDRIHRKTSRMAFVFSFGNSFQVQYHFQSCKPTDTRWGNTYQYV